MNSKQVIHKGKMTLEALTERKELIRSDIRQQKSVIQGKVTNMAYPFKSDPGKVSLSKSVGIGMAVFDGVLFSIKVFRKIRKMFR